MGRGRVLAAAAAVTVVAALQAQTPKWEAVSIRPAKDCGGPGPGATKDGKKSAPDSGGRQGPSPGRLSICTSIANLIPQAYVYQAGGRAHSIGGVVVCGRNLDSRRDPACARPRRRCRKRQLREFGIGIRKG